MSFHDEIDRGGDGCPRTLAHSTWHDVCTEEDQGDPEERLSFLDDIDLTGGTWSLMPLRLQLRVSS